MLWCVPPKLITHDNAYFTNQALAWFVKWGYSVKHDWVVSGAEVMVIWVITMSYVGQGSLIQVMLPL